MRSSRAPTRATRPASLSQEESGRSRRRPRLWKFVTRAALTPRRALAGDHCRRDPVITADAAGISDRLHFTETAAGLQAPAPAKHTLTGRWRQALYQITASGRRPLPAAQRSASGSEPDSATATRELLGAAILCWWLTGQAATDPSTATVGAGAHSGRHGTRGILARPLRWPPIPELPPVLAVRHSLEAACAPRSPPGSARTGALRIGAADLFLVGTGTGARVPGQVARWVGREHGHSAASLAAAVGPANRFRSRRWPSQPMGRDGPARHGQPPRWPLTDGALTSLGDRTGRGGRSRRCSRDAASTES